MNGTQASPAPSSSLGDVLSTPPSASVQKGKDDAGEEDDDIVGDLHTVITPQELEDLLARYVTRMLGSWF